MSEPSAAAEPDTDELKAERSPIVWRTLHVGLIAGAAFIAALGLGFGAGVMANNNSSHATTATTTTTGAPTPTIKKKPLAATTTAPATTTTTKKP
jgi:hypothetical protein